MKKIDYSSLDVRLLRMFISVYDCQSVTKAAATLELTQSTVSHGLNQLRQIVQDDLFVQSGRSITATPKADVLIDKAREIVVAMQDFATPEQYNPMLDSSTFTIAASDYEIETIIKPLLKKLRVQAPLSTLHIAPARTQSQWANVLRSGEVDLVLSPTLDSSELDLVQTTLFSDREVCFYDPEYQSAPKTLAQYCQLPHAIMSFNNSQKTDIDVDLQRFGAKRKIVASAPNFSALASLIKGTDIIATMPSKLSESLFKEFAQTPAPFEVPPFEIVKIWHTRNRNSQRHIWLKNLIE